MSYPLRYMLFSWAKIGFVVCWSLCSIGCQRTVDEQQATGLARNDTIQVTKFDITRTMSLPTKEWHVYYVDEDIICLPTGWHYHESDSVFFVATGSLKRTDERIEIIRYARADVPPSYDAIAQGRYQQVLQESNVTESEGLVKNIFDQHTLYEAHLVTQQAGLNYAECLLLYMNKTYLYQVKIRLPRPDTHATIPKRMEQIINNLQFNHEYLFDNCNPLQRIVIIEPKFNERLKGE